MTIKINDMSQSDRPRASYWDGINERELLVIIAQHTMENGKHLKAIKNILTWFFCAFVICLVVYAAAALTATTPPTQNLYPY